MLGIRNYVHRGGMDYGLWIMNYGLLSAVEECFGSDASV